MATFYQKRDIWHISVTHNGRRITRSLKTNNKDIAKQLRPAIESQLLAEVCGITTKKLNMPFKDLSKRYLSVDHQWTKSTYDLKRYIYARHTAGYPLPDNPNTKAIHIAHINSCWNWGMQNGLVSKANKISGSTIGIPRNRVFTNTELNTLFEG